MIIKKASLNQLPEYKSQRSSLGRVNLSRNGDSHNPYNDKIDLSSIDPKNLKNRKIVIFNLRSSSQQVENGDYMFPDTQRSNISNLKQYGTTKTSRSSNRIMANKNRLKYIQTSQNSSYSQSNHNQSRTSILQLTSKRESNLKSSSVKSSKQIDIKQLHNELQKKRQAAINDPRNPLYYLKSNYYRNNYGALTGIDEKIFKLRQFPLFKLLKEIKNQKNLSQEHLTINTDDDFQTQDKLQKDARERHFKFNDRIKVNNVIQYRNKNAKNLQIVSKDRLLIDNKDYDFYSNSPFVNYCRFITDCEAKAFNSLKLKSYENSDSNM